MIDDPKTVAVPEEELTAMMSNDNGLHEGEEVLDDGSDGK